MPHIAWEQYGIAGVVIGILFFILWRILIWAMKWVDKQSEQHLKEREDWLVVMNGIRAAIELHNQSSIEARRQQSEAHDYQRSEHKEMIATLARINGYKDNAT